jgi:hypothetical protein
MKDNFGWGFDQLFVKDGLVPAFPDSQQIAAKPKWWTCFPLGRFLFIQILYCMMFPGMLLVPKQPPTIPHTHFTMGH